MGEIFESIEVEEVSYLAWEKFQIILKIISFMERLSWRSSLGSLSGEFFSSQTNNMINNSINKLVNNFKLRQDKTSYSKIIFPLFFVCKHLGTFEIRKLLICVRINHLNETIQMI